MEGNVVLTMRDISKTFPGVKALQHVDFTLRKGEIHALIDLLLALTADGRNKNLSL